MTDRDRREDKTASSSVTSALDEKQVLAMLEEAHQDVKAIAKREVEGEPLTEEVLRLRFKNYR